MQNIEGSATLVIALLAPLAAGQLLPFCSELLSLLVWLGGGYRGATAPGMAGRLLFLVPAHDEAHLIERTVGSLGAQRSLHTTSDLVVIADNCSDGTATLAARSGARVLSRTDPDHPGKPAAIGWALDRIPDGGFDAVVIVDADSFVDPGFADGLMLSGPLRNSATQAWFGTANPTESWLTRLASLYADIRYGGQFVLKRRAGLNVPLTGNGMCLGTVLLERVGWSSQTLTEDTELYVRLTVAGETIRFAPEAKLYAQEAPAVSLARTQRRRWQVGRGQVLCRYFVPLLTSTRIGFRQKLDVLAELMSSGPVVHSSVSLAAAIAGWHLGGGPIIVGAFVLALLPTVGWTIWGLARRADRARLMLDLLRLPLYAAWRLSTGLLALGTARATRWERSPREGDGGIESKHP